MDSYDIEELRRLDTNVYRVKVKVHQHQVKIRMLTFKVAGRKVNGRPTIHLGSVVLPTLTEGLSYTPNNGKKETMKSIESSKRNVKKNSLLWIKCLN